MGSPRVDALKSETLVGSFSHAFVGVVPKGSRGSFHTVLTCGQGSWWEGPVWIVVVQSLLSIGHSLPSFHLLFPSASV